MPLRAGVYAPLSAAFCFVHKPATLLAGKYAILKTTKQNNIRVQRAVVRLTQQQLAEQVGVSRQTINAIESGKFIPSTLLALKIARTFRQPVEAIFQLEEED